MALASFVGALSLISPVLAQGDVAAGDQAVAFAREGLKHYQAGAWAEALENFQKADAASHSPVFVLYVARSQRSLGKLLDARATYRKLVSEPLGDDAIPSFRQAQADGRAELAALEPTIPSVVVRAPGASSAARVTIGDRAVAVGVPVELDPGDYNVVMVDGERRLDATITLKINERDREIRLSSRGPLGEGGDPPPLPPPPPAAEAQPGSLVPGIVVLSLGGASLIAGAILGGVALSIDAGITEKCDETGCAPGTDLEQIESDKSTSLALTHASTGTLVAGGVLAAVGVVLLVVRPGGDEGPAVSLGPSGASLTISF